MKRQVILFLVLIMAVSCRDARPKVKDKPDWVIEENKMVDIIVDLRIADAAVYNNTNSPPRDKVKDWAFIMKKHKVSDTLFIKSHDYYAEHPEVAAALYEQAIDKISEMVAANSDDQ
ncbi:MAG: DUF4296 domain-containing protein [Chitinophagaceae bacterium]